MIVFAFLDNLSAEKKIVCRVWTPATPALIMYGYKESKRVEKSKNSTCTRQKVEKEVINLPGKNENQTLKCG